MVHIFFLQKWRKAGSTLEILHRLSEGISAAWWSRVFDQSITINCTSRNQRARTLKYWYLIQRSNLIILGYYLNTQNTHMQITLIDNRFNQMYTFFILFTIDLKFLYQLLHKAISRHISTQWQTGETVLWVTARLFPV